MFHAPLRLYTFDDAIGVDSHISSKRTLCVIFHSVADTTLPVQEYGPALHQD